MQQKGRLSSGYFAHEEPVLQLLFPFAWVEISEWQPDKQNSTNHVSGGAVEQVVQRFTHSQSTAAQNASRPKPAFSVPRR